MNIVKSLFASVSLLALAGTAAADDPKVVTSIKPVHSLVAGVMDGVATPSVIVEGAGSPHSFSLRPSQAQDIQNADVVVWVGPQLETFLDKPIDTVGSNAVVLELADVHDVTRLPFREGVTFEGHDHGDHGEEHAGHDDHAHDDHDDHKHHASAEDDHHGEEEHAAHDDHAHDDHDDHKHHAAAEDDHHDEEEHAGHDDHAHDDHDDHDDHEHHAAAEDDHHGEEEHAGHDHAHDDHDDHAKAEAHGDHHDHAHGEFDVHLWLDPRNAKVFVEEIAETLSEADPANSATYEANAKDMQARLEQLETEIAATLEPVKGKGFVVFHDAYQYFENRFDVSAVGSITVSPEVAPGAERVAAIRDKVADLGVTCVFSEPQFSPNLITVVIEQTDAKASVLDPLGADLEPGPDLYFTLLQNLAQNMRDCLSESS